MAAKKSKFAWEVVDLSRAGRDSAPTIRISRLHNSKNGRGTFGASLSLTAAAQELLGIEPPSTSIVVLFDRAKSVVGVKVDPNGRKVKVSSRKSFSISTAPLKDLVPEGATSVTRPAVLDEDTKVLYADFSGDAL